MNNILYNFKFIFYLFHLLLFCCFKTHLKRTLFLVEISSIQQMKYTQKIACRGYNGKYEQETRFRFITHSPSNMTITITLSGEYFPREDLHATKFQEYLTDVSLITKITRQKGQKGSIVFMQFTGAQGWAESAHAPQTAAISLPTFSPLRASS